MRESTWIGLTASAAVNAGMQVAAGAPQDHLLADEAAQRSRDRRAFAGPHMPVSQTSAISAFSVLAFFGEEGGQRRRTGLLLALEQHGDLARRSAEFLEGAARLQKGHQLAFVVGCAARHESARHAARPRASARTEGCARGPAGRPAARRSGHRTAHAARRGRLALTCPTTIGRPSVGCFSASKPRSRKLGSQPVGRPVAIREMRRHGRDRGDRQQLRTDARAPAPDRRRSRKECPRSWPCALLLVERSRRPTGF